jgi:hypothetical protein
MLEYLYGKSFGSSQTFSRINTPNTLKPSHSSYLSAYEDGTKSVFRNVGIYNSDAGELPRRKQTTFRTWRKFEIKKKSHSLNDCNFLGKRIREYKYLTYIAEGGSNEWPWRCWLRNFEFCKANGFIIQQVQYRNDVKKYGNCSLETTSAG